jgi:hypothetical protein
MVGIFLPHIHAYMIRTTNEKLTFNFIFLALQLLLISDDYSSFLPFIFYWLRIYIKENCDLIEPYNQICINYDIN